MPQSRFEMCSPPQSPFVIKHSLQQWPTQAVTDTPVIRIHYISLFQSIYCCRFIFPRFPQVSFRMCILPHTRPLNKLPSHVITLARNSLELDVQGEERSISWIGPPWKNSRVHTSAWGQAGSWSMLQQRAMWVSVGGAATETKQGFLAPPEAGDHVLIWASARAV